MLLLVLPGLRRVPLEDHARRSEFLDEFRPGSFRRALLDGSLPKLPPPQARLRRPPSLERPLVRRDRHELLPAIINQDRLELVRDHDDWGAGLKDGDVT